MHVYVVNFIKGEGVGACFINPTNTLLGVSLMQNKRRLFVSDVAEAAKLSPTSIRKLADAGKIKNMRRDYNGWRIFNEEAINEVKKLAGTGV